MPDGTDKDQDSKINDSVHPTVLSSSQNHAMPVKHNVSLLNLPDVEESFVCSVFFVCFRFSSGLYNKGISTAADSIQSGWPLWHAEEHAVSRADAANPNRNENFEELRKEQRERLRYASRRYRRHIIETYLLE
ncbi:hypothetical protein TNCV_1649721 [Trichonephila clavipes]|nr:hypothetical protein TNCV_1649721 [Trichonephila clavipes]